MGYKKMANINKKTNLWVKKGLISEDQALDIMKFEKNNSDESLSKKLLLIAATLIGLGVISLIAYNWQDIPSYIKLSVDFIIWVFLINKICKCEAKSNQKSFFLTLAFFFMIASISLIFQIYNIDFYTFHPLTLLCLLHLPFVLPNRYKIINFAWLVSSVPAFMDDCKYYDLFIARIFRDLCEHISSHYSFYGIFVFLFLLALSYGFKILSKKYDKYTLLFDAAKRATNIGIYIWAFANVVVFSNDKRFLLVTFYLLVGLAYIIIKLFKANSLLEMSFVTLLILSYILSIFFVYMHLSMIGLGLSFIILGIIFIYLIKKFKIEAR